MDITPLLLRKTYQNNQCFKTFFDKHGSEILVGRHYTAIKFILQLETETKNDQYLIILQQILSITLDRAKQIYSRASHKILKEFLTNPNQVKRNAKISNISKPKKTKTTTTKRKV